MHMKRKKVKHLRLKIIAVGLIATAVLLTGASNYLVTYAIGRSGSAGGRGFAPASDSEEELSETEKTIAENRKAQAELTKSFAASVKEQTVSITSADGLNLSGGYYKQEDSHDWVIIVHGYRSKHQDMTGFAQRYYDAGYQVLMPDLRACGESEGDYVGMGWLDKDDILQWIDWILEQDEEAGIVLHGVSMGAATVMMTSGEETPDAVKVFIEDCGYTSVWDIFSSELKYRFHLPDFPIMYTAGLTARMRAGYGFQEASALDQVKKCEKPMFFIHGTADDFVPYEMLDRLYEAKPGSNKARLSVEGAGHCQSSFLLGDNYWAQVFAFIDTYK